MTAKRKVVWAQVCDGKGKDGEIPKLFNVQGTPTLYLLSRDGKIAAKRVRRDKLEEELATLLSRKEI
jgi:hypothetical protein